MRTNSFHLSRLSHQRARRIYPSVLPSPEALRWRIALTAISVAVAWSYISVSVSSSPLLLFRRCSRLNRPRLRLNRRCCRTSSSENTRSRRTLSLATKLPPRLESANSAPRPCTSRLHSSLDPSVDSRTFYFSAISISPRVRTCTRFATTPRDPRINLA